LRRIVSIAAPLSVDPSNLPSWEHTASCIDQR